MKKTDIIVREHGIWKGSDNTPLPILSIDIIALDCFYVSIIICTVIYLQYGIINAVHLHSLSFDGDNALNENENAMQSKSTVWFAFSRAHTHTQIFWFNLI